MRHYAISFLSFLVFLLGTFSQISYASSDDSELGIVEITVHVLRVANDEPAGTCQRSHRLYARCWHGVAATGKRCVSDNADHRQRDRQQLSGISRNAGRWSTGPHRSAL